MKRYSWLRRAIPLGVPIYSVLLVNGEGAIVAAPGGAVLGVEWDPYSGDHLQFYKFEASTGQWRYTEMPLHQPFYDREWIAVVPGPVTMGGETHEYASFVKGGLPKEVWFYSTDGLNYIQVTSKDLDRLLSGASVVGALPTAQNADLDWVQANTNGGMTALGDGGAPASPDFLRRYNSPGGAIQLRFRFTSDLLCSGVTPACGRRFNGFRIDELVVGKQAQ